MFLNNINKLDLTINIYMNVTISPTYTWSRTPNKTYFYFYLLLKPQNWGKISLKKNIGLYIYIYVKINGVP